MPNPKELLMLSFKDAAAAYRANGENLRADGCDRIAAEMAEELQAADHDTCASCGSLNPRKTQDAGR